MSSNQRNSRFIISLDFELHWGVFDHLVLDHRGKRYFDVTRELIPVVLDLFRKHDIRATWATVGFLFAHDKKQLLASMPVERPRYLDPALNPYRILDQVGLNEKQDPYHFAASLIGKIKATPGQVIGSHTFSHFYCLESGATEKSFDSDLCAAQRIAYENFGQELRSLVFPRNQFNETLLSSISANGFKSYRSNPDKWFWKASSTKDNSAAKRIIRLADHYLPLSKTTSINSTSIKSDQLNELKATRFFRPYIPKLDSFGGQELKIRKILNEMLSAAREHRDYHLWWHPHNLATHPKKNVEALDIIIEHFVFLRNQYGMVSSTMEDI